MAQTIEDAQQELIEEFEIFDDWMDRYQYIIDLGKKLPDLPAPLKTEDKLVHGCQSQVWLHVEPRGDRLHFQGISDSAIVSGLIAILLRVYGDRTPEEILRTEPTFLEALGLKEHLSPTRSNGLHAMLQTIKSHAAALA